MSKEQKVTDQEPALTPDCIATIFDDVDNSDDEVFRQSLSSKDRLDYGRINLVLDMDECLIHTKFLGQHIEYRQHECRPVLNKAYREGGDTDKMLTYPDSFIVYMTDGERGIVNKRPGLDLFLQRATEHFDVYLYTAAESIYADAVVKELDPSGEIFKGLFFRDSCSYRSDLYLKDLRVIENGDLSRSILVDNNLASFLPQPNNGIPVPPFYDDETDCALDHLWTILETKFMDFAGDVRPKLREMFGLDDLLDGFRKSVYGEDTGHDFYDQQSFYHYERDSYERRLPDSKEEEEGWFCEDNEVQKDELHDADEEGLESIRSKSDNKFPKHARIGQNAPSLTPFSHSKATKLNASLTASPSQSRSNSKLIPAVA